MMIDSEQGSLRKLNIPWLGAEFSELPHEIKKSFLTHFELIKKPNNVSMLTESQIQTAIYYLNSKKHYQIDCALIICQNLNKKLIVIHHNEIVSYIQDSPNVLFCLDIESKPINILIEQIQTHFYHEYHSYLNEQNINTSPDQLQESICGSQGKFMACLDHIQIHLHEPIKIETLADMCHCSTYYFSRQFHSIVGMSFRNYISLKRTEMAKHLLLTQPEEKISSIAFQCGFKDEAYFTRHFKKKIGITPSSYRQKYLQSN
ncbi:helix-turn-helix domain-containing protein [Vibrio rumoiensis]|uniref:helix-turn-helix domain-containing protein n=1 Tax=Vibrio rumoiensis TaxID=76258 RepID=UPI00374A8946